MDNEPHFQQSDIDDQCDRFNFGPFIFERFGRFITLYSKVSNDDQGKFILDITKRSIVLEDEINDLIHKQLEIIKTYDPLQILQSLCFNNCLYDPEKYSDLTNKGFEAYAEYGLSLALSLSFEEERKIPDMGDIEIFECNIKKIFEKIIWFFTTEHTAEPKDELDRFRFSSIASKLIMRGDSVEQHHLDLVRGLFEPHNVFLVQHYGNNINQILSFIEEIRKQIEINLNNQLETLAKIKELHRTFCYFIDTQDDTDKSDEVLFEEFLSINNNNSRKKEIDSQQKYLQKNIFEISPNERLPIEFIKLFSSQFGGNATFIDDGSDVGWPLRDSIIYERPIVEHQGKFYSFIPQLLFRNIIEILEARIQASNKKYHERQYQNHKGDYLGKKSLEYFVTLLPTAEVYENLYYRIEENGITKRPETDGLIIYDDNLFIIEAKAGKLHPSARRGSIEKIKNGVGKLISDAYSQALRTKNYIFSVPKPTFESEKGKVVLEIENPSKFRNIFLINTTLENLGQFSTHLNSLKKHNLIESQEWPWSVFINDLRVISELNDSPSEFLLYLQRRIRANDFPALSASDELDFYAMFLKEGLYLEKGQFEGVDIYQPFGYTDDIDHYYLTQMRPVSGVERPKLNISDNYRFLIRKIEATKKYGFSYVTTTLLSFDQESQLKLTECISDLINRINIDKKSHYATLLFQDIKLGLTVFVDSSGTGNLLKYKEYCDLKKYQTRFDTWISLFINYKEEKIDSIDFDVLHDKWRYLIENEKKLKMVDLSDIGAHPDTKRKVGRNEPCLCGSGKKFKRCCGRKI